MRIELAKVRTYIHSDGRVFVSGKVYDLADVDGNKLLTTRDTRGAPFFKMAESRIKTTGPAVPEKVDLSPPPPPKEEPVGVVTLPEGMKKGGGSKKVETAETQTSTQTRRRRSGGGRRKKSETAATDASGEIDTGGGVTV